MEIISFIFISAPPYGHETVHFVEESMEIMLFHSHILELILIPLLGSTKIGAFIGCDLLMLLSNIQLTADVLSLD